MATFTILSTNQIGNVYRLLVHIQDGAKDYGNQLLKFNGNPSTPALQAVVDAYVSAHALDDTAHCPISLYENKELIELIVTKLKQNPTLTLTQYNNYLNTLQWFEAATIRYFVYRIALAVSASYGVTLANLTESEVLTKLRNFIVATPEDKLRKIIFG